MCSILLVIVFFQNVWEVICSQLGYEVRWDKQSLEENATNFLNKSGMQMHVVTFWSVWSATDVCFRLWLQIISEQGMKALSLLHSYGALKKKIFS